MAVLELGYLTMTGHGPHLPLSDPADNSLKYSGYEAMQGTVGDIRVLLKTHSPGGTTVSSVKPHVVVPPFSLSLDVLRRIGPQRLLPPSLTLPHPLFISLSHTHTLCCRHGFISRYVVLYNVIQ